MLFQRLVLLGVLLFLSLPSQAFKVINTCTKDKWLNLFFSAGSIKKSNKASVRRSLLASSKTKSVLCIQHKFLSPRALAATQRSQKYQLRLSPSGLAAPRVLISELLNSQAGSSPSLHRDCFATLFGFTVAEPLSVLPKSSN